MFLYGIILLVLRYKYVIKNSCTAQHQSLLLSPLDEQKVGLIAVKMLMLNNTCRIVDIYDTQPHTDVTGSTIVTNIYSGATVEESQVYEFIGTDTDAVIEFAISEYSDCHWERAYKHFKVKAPKNYKIVLFDTNNLRGRL